MAEHPAGTDAAESEEYHASTTVPPYGKLALRNGNKKAVTNVSAGHSLDRVVRPKGLEPLTF
jgi:hypothetical protein